VSVTGPSTAIGKVHLRFFRDDRDYCVFSLAGNPHEFFYFSHRERPLRSLFYGDGFLGEIPRLRQEPGLCIECGLGMRILGGGEPGRARLYRLELLPGCSEPDPRLAQAMPGRGGGIHQALLRS
jgi:hypothetical protein